MWQALGGCEFIGDAGVFGEKSGFHFAAQYHPLAGEALTEAVWSEAARKDRIGSRGVDLVVSPSN